MQRNLTGTSSRLSQRVYMPSACGPPFRQTLCTQTKLKAKCWGMLGNVGVGKHLRSDIELATLCLRGRFPGGDVEPVEVRAVFCVAFSSCSSQRVLRLLKNGNSERMHRFHSPRDYLKLKQLATETVCVLCLRIAVGRLSVKTWSVLLASSWRLWRKSVRSSPRHS